MKSNPSQYSGTLKNSVCSVCDESVNHLNRIQQDKHLKDCIKRIQEEKKQRKLFQ